jgi:hypothetical protein
VTIDRAFLFAARSLLRVCSPDRALAILRQLGSAFPELRTERDATRVLRSHGMRGSCLSRSLAVAARAPATQVVIGVDPRREKFVAHAWVEMNGRALVPGDPSGEVIARFPVPASPASSQAA